jgi:hypothetical protein
MFLVVNAEGRYWDGNNWDQQGRAFLSVAQATRSLYEEGEDLENTTFLSKLAESNDPT